MVRPESRFITKLTKRQVEQLEYARDYDDSKRARQRAHAILLSSQHTSVNELVKIFATSRNTICSWLDRWEAQKLDGLHDLQRSGAPPKLDEQEQIRALELLELTPQNSNRVLDEVEKELGKQISSTTLKRIAKKNDLIWKRMRKSLRSKRDTKKFASSTSAP
jgi:transposase